MFKWENAFSGIAFIVMLVIGIGIVIFGLKHIEAISEIANRVATYAFDLAVLAALIALIPAARKLCGNLIVILSFPIGIAVWFAGVEAVYYFWGIVALIIGLLFMGIGPVPMGIVALLFHHPREALWLVINLILVFVVRVVGYAYINSAEKREERLRTQAHEARVLREIIADFEQNKLRD